MDYGFNQLYPTTVLLDKMPKSQIVDDAIQEILTTIDVETPPSDFQNHDVLDNGGPALQLFASSIVRPAFDTYLQKTFDVSLDDFNFVDFRSWLAGAGWGYMIPPHNHSCASVSAVFYLMCEETTRGGELCITDPRINANRGYLDNMKHMFEQTKYMPLSGDMILFPSFLYHYTLPFSGKMRLAMPVDLYLGKPKL